MRVCVIVSDLAFVHSGEVPRALSLALLVLDQHHSSHHR